MEIRHIIEGHPLSKRISTPHGRGILLTNKAGGYYSAGASTKSNGLFFMLDGRLYRIIESIGTQGEIRSVTNNFWNLELRKPGLLERFFMPLYTNTLVYELSSAAPVDIILDMREADDYRSKGRSHKITIGKNLILIEYTKSPDSHSATGHQHPRHGYHIYMAIAGENFIHREKVGKWIKSEYTLDRELDQPPFETEVYHALRLFSRKIVVSASLSRKEAVDTAKKVFNRLHRLSEIQRHYVGTAIRRTGRAEIDAAHKAAANSLDALTFRHSGRTMLYKGLPFSPEESPREEAISLKALIQDGQLETAKDLILRQLETIEANPARFSADEIGWHFKRWADLITLLSEKGIYQEYLRGYEIEHITNRLEKIISATRHPCSDHEGFWLSAPDKTWMDSIERPGPRLELQALRLAMHRLAYKLSVNETYLQQEIELKKKVLDRFWNRKYLRDGSEDGTIRPNIFLAAYIYPELLLKKEWEACFSYALRRLWSGKTGILTLDKTNPLFSHEYDPRTPGAKHNGTSYFWLNNISAIAMHRISPHKFKAKIGRLSAISTREILWKGTINTPSEFSSAGKLSSKGNLCSATSAATYIELVNELYLKK